MTDCIVQRNGFRCVLRVNVKGGAANKPQAIEGVSDAQAAVSLTTNTLETARAVASYFRNGRGILPRKSALNGAPRISRPTAKRRPLAADLSPGNSSKSG